MIKVGWLVLVGLSCCVVCCEDACRGLAEETCRVHGDDSLICVTKEMQSGSVTSEKERLCERSLILYRSLEGGRNR